MLMTADTPTLTPADNRLRPATIMLLIVTLLPILLTFAYILTYSPNSPIGDNWWDTLFVAEKAKAGTLTLNDVFMNASGHRPVFMRLFAAGWSVLTDYDMRVAKFSVWAVALLNLGLIAVLTRRLAPRFWLAITAGASVILFTLYHSFNWLDMYYMHWQQAITGLLAGAGAILLIDARRRWLAFALAALAAWASVYTIALGAAVWPALFVILLTRPHFRRPLPLLLWIGLFVACFMTFNGDWASVPGSASNQADLSRLLTFPYGDAVLYMLAFQAVGFNPEPLSLSVPQWIVLAFVIVGAINAVFIARRDKSPMWLLIPMGLMVYSLAGAFLVAFGRAPTLPIYGNRYGVATGPFWIGLLWIALYAIAGARGAKRGRILIALNVVLIVGFVGLTLVRNVFAVGEQRFITGRDLLNVPVEHSEDICVWQTPLRRDECFRTYHYWGHEQSVYHLAALRLSVFADRQPIPILPAERNREAQVMVIAPHRWFGVYARDWLLSEVLPDQIDTIAPTPGRWMPPQPPASPWYIADQPVESLTVPLANVYDDAAAWLATRTEVIAARTPIHSVQAPEMTDVIAAIDEALRGAGYTRQTVNTLGTLEAVCYAHEQGAGC